MGTGFNRWIFDFFHEINGGTNLIRQCEFFLYSKRDRETVELCKERGYEFPEVTGWIRAVAGDFKFVKQMDLSRISQINRCKKIRF